MKNKTAMYGNFKITCNEPFEFLDQNGYLEFNFHKKTLVIFKLGDREKTLKQLLESKENFVIIKKKVA